VIFGELFQLPTPPHIDVMYTALLIELCKLQPGSLPQVVSFILTESLVKLLLTDVSYILHLSSGRRTHVLDLCKHGISLVVFFNLSLFSSLKPQK